MNIQRIYENRKHFDRKENTAGVMMGIVPVLGFLIFGLLPMFLGVFMSFFEFDTGAFFFKGMFGGKKNYRFCGLDNFINLFRSPNTPLPNDGKPLSASERGFYFGETLKTTFFMLITSVPVGLTLSLLIAFFLTKKIKGKDLLRTVYLIPFICSSVAVTLIWTLFFDQSGVLNYVLSQVTNKQKDTVHITENFYWVVFVVNIWSGTGFNIILLTAALTNVNNSYYEAARVDGANGVQIFFKITLPCISPTLFYLLITSLIGAFQAYAVPDMIGQKGGGLDGKFLGISVRNRHVTVIGYLQQMLNGNNSNPGLASAIGVLLAIIIGIVTIFNFIGSKYWVSYD